jgi:hypothetical protein
MRLDADDILAPDALTWLVEALRSAPAAAVAWGDFETFGRTTFTVPTVPELDPWHLTYVNCVPGAGCLFRRSALEAVGGWTLRDGFEDWDVWLALASLGRSGVHVPRVVFRYRRDNTGRQRDAGRLTRDYFDVLRTRHATVFAARGRNRRRSRAPRLLKVALGCIDALPGVARLTKIQLCELLTHLLWNGGIRITLRMIRQAGRVRLSRVSLGGLRD